MAGVTVNLNWYLQATSPLHDGNNISGARPPSSEYFDADYPLTPTYDETNAIFFNSDAVGLNDGSSYENGYTSETAALTALNGRAVGQRRLYARGTFDVGSTQIALSGLGGVGASGQEFIFQADPVNGCNIVSSNPTGEGGIEFGGQAHWIIDGFNITGGGRIFSYFPGGTSAGGCHHMTFRNITGTMSISGDNVGWIHFDVGADYIGAFNSVVQGPGLGGNQNTSCIFLSRIPHWRVQNCEMYNAPQPIYYKHLEAASHINSPAGYLISNYFHDGVDTEDRDVHLACSDTLIENNIFDCRFNLLADGGGDIGNDNNVIKHNTFMKQMRVSGNNWVSENNTINDNIFVGQYLIFPYVATASTNLSNYNLFASTIYNNSTTLTLAQWQAASTPAGQDANSLAGTPSFVGGANPTTIAGFALSGGTGVNAASDGTDMGADVTTVGAAA